MKKLLFAVILVSIFASCDKIDAPYSVPVEGLVDTLICPTPTFTLNTNPQTKVFVEDYTGHRCGNCPRAGETLKNIINNNPNRVVPIAVHVGNPWAVPLNSGDKFRTDFRTETGNTWDAFFGISVSSLPQGMVNRMLVNGNRIQGFTTWTNLVNQTLNNKPISEFDLQLNVTYNESERRVCAFSFVHSFINYSNPLKIGIYLTEDKIIDWQKNYQLMQEDVPDYEHNFTLRAALAGPWGFDASIGAISAGWNKVEGRTLILQENWKAENCNVIAIIYDATTFEILQSEIVKVIP